MLLILEVILQQMERKWKGRVDERVRRLKGVILSIKTDKASMQQTWVTVRKSHRIHSGVFLEIVLGLSLGSISVFQRSLVSMNASPGGVWQLNYRRVPPLSLNYSNLFTYGFSAGEWSSMESFKRAIRQAYCSKLQFINSTESEELLEASSSYFGQLM